MTVPRMVGLLIALTLLGIGVVALRVEQAVHTRRMQQLHLRQIELRREIWTQEMERARLLSPQQIRERARELGMEVGMAQERD